jgi:hypothetical protein
MNYYIKLWGGCFFIITVIYLLCLYLINTINKETFYSNGINNTLLKTITPAYPPPLINFSDSNNILKKVLPISKIS